jgi:DNA-binding transcriptional regulator YiaG
MSSRHIKYVANKLNEKDKIDLIQQMHEEGLHSNEFGHMHGISGSTIRKWERKLKVLQETGVDTFHKVGGQALIDEESSKKAI